MRPPPEGFVRRHIRFQIPKDRAGVSLLDFVTSRFPYHTREGWAEAIAAKRLRVNERATAVDRVLQYRDVIEYTGADIREPAANLHVERVFEDSEILVVNKPPNLACHPGGRYFHHTLWAVLRNEFGIESPAFINRLDRETSGLVLIAKTEGAEKNCRAQFAGRAVEKRYIGLVEGEFPERILATGYLVEDPASPVKKKRLFVPCAVEAPPLAGARESEWAVTEFRRLAVHGAISAVEARPATGRLHQIRAVLEALGFPVVGDKLYGGDPGVFLRFCREELTDDDRRKLRLDRQALHAAGLRFRHPRFGKPISLEAPLPEDMAELMRQQDASTPKAE